MAESFNKKHMSAINDDIIREALKTGLKSFHPSDDLVRKTLDKCREEIYGKANNKNRWKNFNPFLYKLGMPVAAGVLALILFFNMSQLFTNYKGTSTPQKAMNSTAEAAVDSGAAYKPERAGTESDYTVSSAQPEIAFSGAPNQTKDSYLIYSEEVSKDKSIPEIHTLNSSLNRTRNREDMDENEYLDAFRSIVSQYNSAKGTQLALDGDGVTRIHTLADTGVDAEMLLKAKSYRDILSGEGYWALPLKNAQGVLEGFLGVIDFENDDPNMAVSSEDYIFTFEGHKFLVSSKSANAFSGKECGDIFDSGSIIALAKESGYKNVSEPIIADINYGMDYLAFIEADDNELAVPFFTHENLFGLENKRLYALDEIFKIISENIK